MPAPSERLLLLLLPGLDGSGALFAPFVEHLPAAVEPRIVPLPAERPLEYEELVTHVRALLPVDRPFALLGESFSGPIALGLAAARPAGLVGTILVATYHRRPVPRWLSALGPLAGAIFSRPPPRWVARRFLAGSDAPAELIAALRAAVGGVPLGVLTARVRAALRVDASEALAACGVPILCVGGAQDRLLRSALTREMRALHPRLEVRTLAAPHLVLQRRPEEAAGIVSEFLAGAFARA